MKKYLLIIILVFLTCKNSNAKIIPTYLPELIKWSKIIVYGKIISVDKNSFRIITIIKIKSSINNFKTDTLTIKKFENISCGARYAEYEIGQEAIFFLKLNEENQLRTMGGGNAGELIVNSKMVYISNYNQEIFEAKLYDFINGYYEFIRIDLATTIEGIRIYIDKLEQIEMELNRSSPSTSVVYQYSVIDKLPDNDFLKIVIDQRKKGMY